ncbi:hypothetical protein [Streptomyces fructofermentans]|uniref:Uncharacterized protein n=1 Tax=Streptomyces fructofermentans TaxID=152141 RepID=A0A918NE86_9ACTN|nr:hypothetical protein [Streptomyces fructofermentans]GGX64041.1 hypothetical protein GCM10010515_34720 [Streptomyces fructofermentans]
MFDGIRGNRGLRRATQAWFWHSKFHAVSVFTRSRAVWVVVGNAGTLLTALAGTAHYWSRPVSFAGFAVLQLVCLAFQAIALVPVAWPGGTATPRDVRGFSELHQSLTVATVCGSWIFGVLPGLALLTLYDVEAGSPQSAALLVPGTALMLACVAGLITATGVAVKVMAQHRDAPAPPGVSEGVGSGEVAEVDSGGFDSD